MILLFVSFACANMLIPSYAAIRKEFNIPESLIAIPDASFVLVSALFALMWGYFTDRIDRGKVIMFGAFSWTIGMILTGFSTSYWMLVISRLGSGAGLGCVLPVGYSVISDAIPPDERSGWFGTLAILSSISNGVGQGLSSFLGPILTWRFPFLLLSGISIVLIIFLFFVKIPARGASEDELIDLADLDLEYSYRISMKDISSIINKKTNRFLIIQGFFSIIPGTILTYFLVTMLHDHYFFALPEEIRLQTATIFGGMVGMGYILGNLLLSYLGDVLYRRNKKNRARLATFCMIASIPLAVSMLLCLRPIDISLLEITYPAEIAAGDMLSYTIMTIGQIFTAYPSYIALIILALGASILSAGPVANRNAVMIDVNMPEHKGTAASLYKLSEQTSKSFVLFLSFFLITILGSLYNMMLFSFIFWIPAGILWYLASRKVENDMDTKRRILSERKQVSIIDYIFEIEIQMDRAIQKIQDSKYYLNDEERFFTLLNDAIRLFTFCERDGECRSITNIEKKAHIWKLRALTIKQEVKTIYKQLKKESTTEKEKYRLTQDLHQILLRISEWETSTFGKIQTYYEDAYLKIVEARLLRNNNVIKSMSKINRAIDIYTRVNYLLRERIEILEEREDEEIIPEDKIILKREKEIFEKSSKALKATINLKKQLSEVFSQLEDKGVTQKDLQKISELTEEFQVDIYKVIDDTFGEDSETIKAIKQILKKIDDIFNEYDKHKETDFKVF